MIKINNIKCSKGQAILDRLGPLWEWRGEVTFSSPQKKVSERACRYYGPLYGYTFKIINITGLVYITSTKNNKDGLIESVKFIGSGPPYYPLLKYDKSLEKV